MEEAGNGQPSGNGVPPKARPEDVEQRPVLAYPTDYLFKIMGLADDDFQTHATGLVQAVVDLGDPPRVTSRRVGKYVSISVSVTLQSEEQRRAIYQALWEDKRVVYYL